MQKLFLLFLTTQLAFSQSKPLPLEEKIYIATETFAEQPNLESLKKLEIEERKFQPKTNADFLAIVILNCNKAYYQNKFGLTNDAIKSYEKAWRLYQVKKLNYNDIVEDCLKPLGNLYTITSDFENAENTIKQYFYIANIQKNQALKCAAIINLSNVYQSTGKITEAIDLLKKTIQTEKLTNTQKGILQGSLGANYLFRINNLKIEKNDFENAERSFLGSIALLKNDASQVEELSNSYRNLSNLKFHTDVKSATIYFEKAKTEFLKIANLEPRKKAKFYYDEATLYLNQDNIAEARKSIALVFSTLLPNYSSSKTVLPNQNSLYAETILIAALDLQAAIYLEQNKPEKALESFGLSFHVEELLQSLLVYENSKIITQISNRNRTEKCIDIYYSMYQKEKKIEYIERAFLLSEQTKSAVLRQTISNNKTKSREEKLILEQLQNWNTVILKEQQKLNYADIDKINDAIKKQNELMLLLKSKKTNSNSKTTKEISLNDLYLKLENDKAILIEYFIGLDKFYSFTLENKTIKIQVFNEKLHEDSIFYKFINLFKNGDIITNNPLEYNNLANKVHAFLKLPENKLNKNLILIPDGILNFLPFEALITKRSTSSNFAKMHYLLKKFKIGYTNSADFYVNSLPFKYKKESVLGVFPIFENSFLELAFSKKELQNLKKNFSGKYLENKQATFENFKLNAANYSILHLSTHASSGDILEPASIKFYNQEILFSELYYLNVNPNLVVLSACETGLGKLYKAEGAMSVARGFQLAGAQNLLFSLWKVNDYTTSVLMKDFYKNIKNGKSYFNANHQSKLDFLKDSSIPNAKKSPYYWSAFVYYGSLESQNSGINYLMWFSIVVGLIALFLTYKFRKQLKALLHSKIKK